MLDCVHVAQRVTHPDHGGGIVETIVCESRRGLRGGKCVDVLVLFDGKDAAVPVCAEDLRDEADDDGRK